MSFLSKVHANEEESPLSQVIDDATDAVLGVWKAAANRQTSEDERARLRGVLEDFFSDFKYTWFDKQDEA